MEKVIATVTGYHGSKRFKLIKLIAHSGANYVRSMSSSNTHLVCWKLEGQKYSLAKKFNTIGVNHQWMEECIRQGRRVPEAPYMLESGEEVGPLVTEVPKKVKKKEKFVSPYDIYFDNPSEPATWIGSVLMEEVRLEHKENAGVKDSSGRGKRRVLRKRSYRNFIDNFIEQRRNAQEDPRDADDENVKDCVQHHGESTRQNCDVDEIGVSDSWSLSSVFKPEETEETKKVYAQVSERKSTTCPLCKSSFIAITKIEDAGSSDQKIYSQTVPDPSSTNNVLASRASACSRCYNSDPEDLLIRCHICIFRRIHSFCLDPYLVPWTCNHCSDIVRLYERSVRGY